MNENYNKLDYLDLLKKESIDRKLNSEDYHRLSSYRSSEANYLNWCIREHYLELLDNFHKGKMETFYFCRGFENARMEVDNFQDALELYSIVVSPNDKSLIFGDLLEKIFYETEAYIQAADFNSTLAPSENYGIEVKEYEKRLKEHEVELKESVKKTYLKIQNFLKIK